MIRKFIFVCLIGLVLITAYSLFDNKVKLGQGLLIISFNLAILLSYYFIFVKGYHRLRSSIQRLAVGRALLFGLMGGLLYLVLAGYYLLHLPSSILYQTAILLLIPLAFGSTLGEGGVAEGTSMSLISLLLGLVLIEILLHVIPVKNISATLAAEPHLDYPDLYENPPDAPFREGGHLKPDLDAWVVGDTPAARVQFVTNSKGFRNDQEFSYHSSPDAYRIIYVGDSFVGGYRVDQQETSGYILDNRLTEMMHQAGREHKIELIVALLEDTAIATQWMKAHGLKYQPDLVIIGVTLGNDVAQTCISREPAFSGFTTAPVNQIYLPADAFDPSLWQLLQKKFEATSVGSLATQTLYPDETGIISWYAGSRPNRINALDPANGLGLFYTPLMADLSLCLDHFQSQLTLARQLVEENNAEMLVVLFPQRYQVNGREWRATHRRYLLNLAHFDLEQPNRIILAGCEQENVACFDLLPAFRQAAGGPLYMPLGDMHWNARGHRIAGEAIADYVWSDYLGQQ